ncbi:MAG: EAL domain-containing protein [Gammaproteobacteria bacterium]|nr:EAL domain-containing protein [Gammaproteobacteria bacterium]
MAQPLLNSAIGRRLLLSFMLAALLPMGVVALVAYFQVGGMLENVNDHRLQQDSRSLGMSFVESLNWRADDLQREAARLTQTGATPNPRPAGFLNYRLLENSSWPELTREQGYHLSRGGTLLFLEGKLAPSMLTALPKTQGLLLGRLDKHSLWRNEQAPEHYCVVSAVFQSFYCTPGLASPTAEAWPQLLAQRNSGVFPWQVRQNGSDVDYLVAFWQARLRASYAHPGIIVMVANPRQAVLKGLERFQQVFSAIVVAAIALAFLLAVYQIRRQMHPLEMLTEGTRRLATGDLGVTVQEADEGEFGSLARAFNQMSGNLRYKFHMLQMLAELDRAILGASGTSHLVQLVLEHIRQAIPCDSAGLIRINANDTGTFMATASEIGKADGALSCPDILERLGPDAGHPWLRLQLDTPPAHCLRPLFDEPLKEVLLFPSRVNGRLDSLLLLAYEKLPEDFADIEAAGLSVADRLSVAASNLVWEEKLYHQAHYDALTDLPNRVLLRDRVEQALVRAERERTSVALILLDLDNFKQVNDSLGHAAGDALLIECAQRLKSHIRQSDTVARLGGDEFILVVPELAPGSESDKLESLARKLNEVLAMPMLIAGRQVTISASIGIALYSDEAENFEDLLRMADAAMYEAKLQQPGGFRFYSANINEKAQARFELVQDLREAISRQEFLLYYQPKFELAGRRIIGAEALARWNSPKRGLVAPGLFIHLLDEMGLTDWLSDWVLKTACAQMAAWDRLGLPPLSVSVNISPAQFQFGNLLEKVRGTLDVNGLAPQRLEIEILETTAVDHSPEVRDTLAGLREMNVNIALDDFGTGYSSLVYLTQVPANILKLDRAFIIDLASDARQQAIVERIIALAKVLDFCVVAEGVEGVAQMDLLAAMHCDVIQGYLISRPLPPDDFVHLLKKHVPGNGLMQ